MDFLEYLDEDIQKSDSEERHILTEFRRAFTEELSSPIVFVPAGVRLVGEGCSQAVVSRLVSGVTLLYEWCEFQGGPLGPQLIGWLRARNRHLDSQEWIDFSQPLPEILGRLLVKEALHSPATVVVSCMTGWTVATLWSARQPDLGGFADRVNAFLQGTAAQHLAGKVAHVRRAERWQAYDSLLVLTDTLAEIALVDLTDKAAAVALSVQILTGLASHVLGGSKGLDPDTALADEPWMRTKPNKFANCGRHLDRLLIETA